MRANVEDRGMKGDCTPLMEVIFLFSLQVQLNSEAIFLPNNPGASFQPYLCQTVSFLSVLSSRLQGSCNLKYAQLPT